MAVQPGQLKQPGAAVSQMRIIGLTLDLDLLVGLIARRVGRHEIAEAAGIAKTFEQDEWLRRCFTVFRGIARTDRDAPVSLTAFLLDNDNERTLEIDACISDMVNLARRAEAQDKYNADGLVRALARDHISGRSRRQNEPAAATPATTKAPPSEPARQLNGAAVSSPTARKASAPQAVAVPATEQPHATVLSSQDRAIWYEQMFKRLRTHEINQADYVVGVAIGRHVEKNTGETKVGLQ
jgi:hypothetical protein